MNTKFLSNFNISLRNSLIAMKVTGKQVNRFGGYGMGILMTYSIFDPQNVISWIKGVWYLQKFKETFISCQKMCLFYRMSALSVRFIETYLWESQQETIRSLYKCPLYGGVHIIVYPS